MLINSKVKSSHSHHASSLLSVLVRSVAQHVLSTPFSQFHHLTNIYLFLRMPLGGIPWPLASCLTPPHHTQEGWLRAGLWTAGVS